MEIFNKTKKITVCDNVIVAENFKSRLLGLMFKRDFSGCLLIKTSYSCSIHTCFMFFSIDVAFLDENFIVLDIVTLRPWKFYFPNINKGKKCKFIIEAKKGKLRGKLDIGDELELVL